MSTCSDKRSHRITPGAILPRSRLPRQRSEGLLPPTLVHIFTSATSLQVVPSTVLCQIRCMGRFRFSILVFSITIFLFLCVSWIGFLYSNLPPASLLNSQSQSGSDHQNTQPRWLISTMSPVDSLARRDSIRHTWQALYASPVFETRFVLANYNDSWSPSIEKENRTYGDLVRLETVQSGAKEAHTTKTIEYFKHIVAEAGSGGRSYDFVSKIGDDVFLVASKFFADYLAPRLHPTPATRTLIARWMRKKRRYP